MSKLKTSFAFIFHASNRAVANVRVYVHDPHSFIARMKGYNVLGGL